MNKSHRRLAFAAGAVILSGCSMISTHYRNGTNADFLMLVANPDAKLARSYQRATHSLVARLEVSGATCDQNSSESTCAYAFCWSGQPKMAVWRVKRNGFTIDKYLRTRSVDDSDKCGQGSAVDVKLLAYQRDYIKSGHTPDWELTDNGIPRG